MWLIPVVGLVLSRSTLTRIIYPEKYDDDETIADEMEFQAISIIFIGYIVAFIPLLLHASATVRTRILIGIYLFFFWK